MTPRNFCDSLSQKFIILVSHIKPSHIPEIAGGKSFNIREFIMQVIWCCDLFGICHLGPPWCGLGQGLEIYKIYLLVVIIKVWGWIARQKTLDADKR